MRKQSRLSVSSALAAVLAAGTILAVPAHAQEADGADEAENSPIVVTGSRIRHDPLSQNSPVVFVDNEDIAKTGLSSIADVLQRLPGSAGGLNSKVNNSGNLGNPPDGGGVGAGSAEIDLRYLGAKRTLVLVDGLRFVNATSASGIPATVDLNSIPSNMIDRVEVLQAGASPLYGSDAIAGVVNVITAAQQEGLRASAQIGQFRQGDGTTQNYALSYGIKGDRTNLVFGAAYVKQNAVRSGTRDISKFPNPGQTACSNGGGGCSSAAVNGRFLTDFGNLTISTAPDSTPTFAELRPFTVNDRFNFAPFNYIQTPVERYGAWMSFKQEVNDSLNLRAKLIYNRRNSQNQAAFEPLFLGPDAGNGAGSLFDRLSIDVTNPYNPFGVTLSAGLPGQPAQNYSFIARRLVEAGQRTFDQEVDTFSGTLTFDGSFNLGEHKWYWDANAVFGINEAHQAFTGNVNAAKVQQALGPVAACTAPCVPLNLFGGAGSITPAMLDFIGFTQKDKSDQRMYDYTLNFSGGIATLPAGTVSLALGYEHRLQKASFTPDPIVSAGLSADIPAQPAAGKYNVDEFYAELNIPLLADQPFFKLLELDGAVRHSDYSISGGSTTYTGTLRWRPTDDLMLRGSYSTGFRAPSLGELFGGRSRFDLPANDPCTNVAGSPYQTNATVRTNCHADGVPTDGSYQEDLGGQLPIITSGNINLKPEKSKNLLFSAVYSPEWARSGGGALSLEANYYDIRVNNAIGAVDPNLTLNNCAFLADAPSCAAVVRTSRGFINEIDGTLQNLDSIRTRGLDVTLNYRTGETGFGKFGLNANGTWLLKYHLSASNGFVEIDRRGTERGSPDQAFPKFKGNFTVDWNLDGFGASFTGRYIDSVLEANGNVMDSRFYGDVQLTFNPKAFDQRFTLTLGVNNVFDQDPPGCFTCSINNFDPTTYDVPGQFGYVRLTYKM